MEHIRALSSAAGHEERVAGVLLLNKLLEGDSLTATEARRFTKEIISLLGPAFILQMLETVDQKGIVRGAALSLIAHSIKLECDRKFRSLAPQIVDLLFREVGQTVENISEPVSTSSKPVESQRDVAFRNNLTVALKWLFLRCDDTTRLKIFESIALGSKLTVFSSAVNLVWLMNVIEDIAQVPGCEQKLYLPQASAEAMCVLMYRGLHGSATEALRDGTLSAILGLLQSSSCVASSWSLAGLSSVPSSGVGKSSVDDQRQQPSSHKTATTATTTTGKFAMLLCSIVGGEVHLLLEEAIALHLSTDADDPAKDDETTATASSATSSSATSSSSVETRTSALHPSARPLQSDEVRTSRVERVERMLDVCLSLVHAVCGLLLGGDDDQGDENGDGGDDDQAYGGGWTTLPATAMLHIQQAMHSVMKKIFDFLREIKESNTTTNTNIDSNTGGAPTKKDAPAAGKPQPSNKMFADDDPQQESNRNTLGEEPHSVDTTTTADNIVLVGSVAQKVEKTRRSLKRIVQRSAATLSLWVVEDGGLHDPFLDALHNLLRWSSVPASVQLSGAVAPSIDSATTESTWRVFVKHAARSSRVGSSSSNSGSTSSTVESAGDITSSASGAAARATTTATTTATGAAEEVETARKTSETLAEEKDKGDEGDVLLLILPALSAIISECSALGLDESSALGLEDSDDSNRERATTVLNVILDKLSSCDGLFGRLVNIVVATAHRVVAERLVGNIASSSISGSSGGSSISGRFHGGVAAIRVLCVSGVRACEVLSFLLHSRGKELRLLQKSESSLNDAVAQLFTVKFSVGRELMKGAAESTNLLQILVALSLAAADYIDANTMLLLGPSSSSTPSSSSAGGIEEEAETEASLVYDWEQLSQSLRELVDAAIPVLQID